MSEVNANPKYYQRDDLPQPNPDDDSITTIGTSTFRNPKPWKPQGVVLKEKLERGDIVHIRDFDRPSIEDKSALDEYGNMLWGLIDTYGHGNVHISEPVDTLGTRHPGTNREKINTERAGLYIAAAALRAVEIQQEVAAEQTGLPQAA